MAATHAHDEHDAGAESQIPRDLEQGDLLGDGGSAARAEQKRRDDTDGAIHRERLLMRDERQTQVTRRARDRMLALFVALAVIATLGGGWLVDGLATAPRNMAITATQSRQVGLATVTLALSPAPLRAGRPESFILRVTDVAGVAVAGARARCALSMPTMAMELPGEDAAPTNTPGEYACGPHTLESGTWALAITLRLPDGMTGHTTFTLNAA